MKKIFLFCIILIFTLSGCKYKHYYNQDKTIRLYIDSYLMLKLLQEKKFKFDKVNIVSSNNISYKDDPFKRLLNRDDYVKDFELIPKEWNTNNSYNNSYYDVNEKYRKFLIDPWDDILLKVLYADILGYNIEDFGKLLSLKSGKGDYTDTHIFLALLLLKENKAFDENQINNQIKSLVKILVYTQDKENEFSDLFAERIVFLYWAGFGNLVKKEWINIIRKAKNKDFGWPLYEGEESNPHSTGLALLSLIYFNEGKNKQDFY